MKYLNKMLLVISIIVVNSGGHWGCAEGVRATLWEECLCVIITASRFYQGWRRGR